MPLRLSEAFEIFTNEYHWQLSHNIGDNMFILDEKEYDENKLNEQGKVALVQIQNITNKRNQLALQNDELNVLSEHYSKILKDNLPEEEKKEENGTGE